MEERKGTNSNPVVSFPENVTLSIFLLLASLQAFPHASTPYMRRLGLPIEPATTAHRH